VSALQVAYFACDKMWVRLYKQLTAHRPACSEYELHTLKQVQQDADIRQQRATVRATVGATVRATVRATGRAAVRVTVRAAVGATVRATVRAAVRVTVRATVRTAVRATVRAAVRANKTQLRISIQ